MNPYPVVISSKGQVVIPAELRTRLGLGKGAAATWTEENGRLVLTPFERILDEVQGMLKPRDGEPTLSDDLARDRELERQREKQ